MVSGIRECKNSATSWPDACLGGTDFSAYCREGHEGPLCALCKDMYFKDKDTKMCEECGDSGGLPEGTFTSAPFLGLYALLFLLILGKLFKRTLVRYFDKDGDGDIDSNDLKIMLSQCCPCLTRIFNNIISSQKVLRG